MSDRGHPLPQIVSAYLLPLVLRSRHPAFLRTDSKGHVVEAGGALRHYGIAAVQPGQLASDQIGLLTGLLPHIGEPLHLSAVQTDAGACADLHIFGDAEDTWVVLLDTSNEHDQKQAMQQKGNELSLRSERQGLVLDAHLGKSVAAHLLAGRWGRSGGGERREVSILFADIRRFTPFSEANTPEQVFLTLNQYLPAMIEPVEAAGGVIEHLAGDAIMAIFGLGDEAAAQFCAQAIVAGRRVQQAVHSLNQQRIARGEESLGIGIGIATGPVSVGVIGTLERRGFAAIGHHVNVAARLQGQAGPAEVVCDEHSYQLWQAAARQGVVPSDLLDTVFEERQVALKGVRDVLRVYVISDAAPPASKERA